MISYPFRKRTTFLGKAELNVRDRGRRQDGEQRAKQHAALSAFRRGDLRIRAGSNWRYRSLDVPLFLQVTASSADRRGNTSQDGRWEGALGAGDGTRSLLPTRES